MEHSKFLTPTPNPLLTPHFFIMKNETIARTKAEENPGVKYVSVKNTTTVEHSSIHNGRHNEYEINVTIICNQASTKTSSADLLGSIQ